MFDFINNNKSSDWQLKVHGVRSFAPAVGKEYAVYGGHTACVSVKIKNETLIFDAGSGITEIGKNFASDLGFDDNTVFDGFSDSPFSQTDFPDGFGDSFNDDFQDGLQCGFLDDGFLSDELDDSFLFSESSGLNEACKPLDACGIPGIDSGDSANMLMLGEYELDKNKRLNASKVYHIFLTGLSLDTVSPLMSFLPLGDEKAVIHIYGCDTAGMNVAEALSRLFRPPFWSCTLADVPAVIYFHRVVPGEAFVIGSLSLLVSTLSGGGGILYRIEEAAASAYERKKCLVYGSACSPESFSDDNLKDFLTGSVLCVCDCAFLPEELLLRPADGHSSWKSWLPVLSASGVENALMLRYSNEYTDEVINGMEKKAAAEAYEKYTGLNVIFAKEGMDIIL